MQFARINEEVQPTYECTSLVSHNIQLLRETDEVIENSLCSISSVYISRESFPSVDGDDDVEEEKAHYEFEKTNKSIMKP